jgi:hypothetical protein
VFCEGVFHCEGDDESRWWIEHAPDCPWTSLPAIVGALEAAEAVVAAQCWCNDGLCSVCQALADALKGEQS